MVNLKKLKKLKKLNVAALNTKYLRTHPIKQIDSKKPREKLSGPSASLAIKHWLICSFELTFDSSLIGRVNRYFGDSQASPGMENRSTDIFSMLPKFVEFCS